MEGNWEKKERKGKEKKDRLLFLSLFFKFFYFSFFSPFFKSGQHSCICFGRNRKCVYVCMEIQQKGGEKEEFYAGHFFPQHSRKQQQCLWMVVCIREECFVSF